MPPVAPRRHTWAAAFLRAFRGAGHALGTQRNFKVHLPAAVAMMLTATALHAGIVEWCLLLLCVTTVFTAELFNTAIEHLARAVTREENHEVRDALDTAAGAVLAASIGAAVVGAVVLAWLLR